ncbi:hypothetical protein STRIP9103_07717 [Streptomyces ipomoeae 91-03]|uniref:Uncharacterized protein n=1 Tax=Streptomyces ipomoeae 91-03 TaxID=698759 RepID=L1KTI8_9ACTN|nr:hypothetical protein STRIP9103_07717 [Streptomyces ipomoeae 91-03]
MLFERCRARRSLMFRAQGQPPGGRPHVTRTAVNHPAQQPRNETSGAKKKRPASGLMPSACSIEPTGAP